MTTTFRGPLTHPPGHRSAQERILDGSVLDARRIEVDAGHEVQLIEAGDGAPLVFLHGTGAGAPFLAPLLERIEGARVIAPDRPGQGLSDPIDIPRRRFRDVAVAWIDRLLDSLGLASTMLAGHSMGGLWALWYALARPDRITRLVLVAPPLLPGTRCPLPYRVMGTPGLFGLVQRLSPPSRTSAMRFAAMMGEGDSLPAHPALLDLMVAANEDPIATRTNVNEARAIISPLALVTRSGFRRTRVRDDELRHLDVPTLLIWGDRDPLGDVGVARAIVDRLPTGELAVVAAGHGPWLGQPDETAGIVTDFLRRGRS